MLQKRTKVFQVSEWYVYAVIHELRESCDTCCRCVREVRRPLHAALVAEDHRRYLRGVSFRGVAEAAGCISQPHAPLAAKNHSKFGKESQRVQNYF